MQFVIMSLLLVAMLPASRGVGLPSRMVGKGGDMSGRVAPVGRSSATRSRVAVAQRDVVEAGRTEETVQELNRINHDHLRCHVIGTDDEPSVDPFALVADAIAPLSGRVAEDLTAEEPTLTASAQHFFGSGETREER